MQVLSMMTTNVHRLGSLRRLFLEWERKAICKPVVHVATLKNFRPPEQFKGLEFPEKNKLRFFDKVPLMPPNTRPPKSMKRLIDMRGPELVQNEFLHKQYGIVALTGGQLRHGHFEMIRNTINRNLDTRRMFAIWRVDPPWKPITKKGQGKRMGGGKGAIDHYTTPVKAGRVIIEVGGSIEFGMVKRFLIEVAGKLPFRAIGTCHQDMIDAKKKEEKTWEENLNPYTFEYCIKNNIQGCHSWMSTYDPIWFGKYR